MASTVPDKAMPIFRCLSFSTTNDKEFAQKKIKKVECIEKADEVNAKYKKKAAKADTDFNAKVKGDRARKEKAVAEKTKAEGIYDGIQTKAKDEMEAVIKAATDKYEAIETKAREVRDLITKPAAEEISAVDKIMAVN